MMKIARKLGLFGTALLTCLTFAAASLSATTFADTPSSSGFQMAYVDQSGNVYLKSGSISAPYSKIWNSSDPATSVKVSHNGIAVLDSSGNLYVNVLPIQTTWTKVTTNTSQQNFSVSDTSVVLLLNGGLYYKALAHLTYAWGSSFFDSVQSFKMTANGTIAAVGMDGTLYEAFGGYGAQWIPVATNFNSYDISNNDLAAVFGNELYVMAGAPVNNRWNPAYSNAASVQLSPNGNIGVTDQAGNLDVALGGYGSQWTNNVRSAADSNSTYVSDALVTAFYGNTLFAKLGSITGSWSQIAGAGDAVAYSIE